jgi:hypothetical protein
MMTWICQEDFAVFKSHERVQVGDILAVTRAALPEARW